MGGILSHPVPETRCAAFVGEAERIADFFMTAALYYAGLRRTKEKQSAMVLSRGKFAFCVNRNVSEKGRNKPDLCGGRSE